MEPATGTKQATSNKKGTTAMNSMIDNFINGNLRHAKKQAKRFSRQAIQCALETEYGFSTYKALVTARYLKGQADFQEACDAA